MTWSSIRQSFLHLSKKPYYLFFGVFFVFGIWTPITLLNEIPPQIEVREIILPEAFSSIFKTEYAVPALIFFFLALWLMKIFLLSCLYLHVFFSQKKHINVSILKIVRKSIWKFPTIFSLHPLLFFAFTFLFIFIALPVISLIDMGSISAAWFLGTLAFFIFSLFSITIFSLFLFSHFYILFSGLPLKLALDASAFLFQKNRKESAFFLSTFLIIFLVINIFILFLPGFYLSKEGLFVLQPNLSTFLNTVSFFISYFLLSFYFTIFFIASVFFFLHIAKQPKKKILFSFKKNEALPPLFKEKSETLQE